LIRLTEDLIQPEEREAIERVLSAVDIRFDKLAALAGLDPQKDFQNSDLRALNFCGADLRGYDFSGSDLRDVAIDGNTIIDASTVLTDAEIRWIDEGDIPIVQLMTDVTYASTAEARTSSLAELEKRFGKTNHVIQFVVNAASETDSLDCYLDYFDFLPAELTAHHLEKLVLRGEQLLSKRLSRAKSRTRRDTTKIFASSIVLDRLSSSDNSLGQSWYHQLALVADEHGSTHALKGTVIVPTEELLLLSLKKLKEVAQ
jgi:hypothetical protein